MRKSRQVPTIASLRQSIAREEGKADSNRYRIERRLGSGGMGEVFLATDNQSGKPVALKFLKTSLASNRTLRNWFEREIAICSALQSPHIVRINDSGIASNGHPFYAMEYLEGQTLGQLLAQTPRLGIDRAIEIVRQICAGLQLIHRGVVLCRDGAVCSKRMKIVHCDLKPENIFVVPTPFGNLVKIIDFGIARILHRQGDRRQLETEFSGTYRYASPQQVEGDRALDERSDIYSLGVILYEILSGCDPFGFSAWQGKMSREAWIMAHRFQSPIPLRSLSQCQALSSQLEAVVMKCLNKLPQQRFASVAELSRALQRVVLNLPMTTPIAIEPERAIDAPISDLPKTELPDNFKSNLR